MKTLNHINLFSNKNFLLASLLILISFSMIFTSCKDSKENISNNAYSKLLNSTKDIANHRWFYFTDTGFLETQSPSLAPEKEPAPWTETPRITAGTIVDSNAFFTVNKLGILVCPAVSGFQPNGISSQTYLVKDEYLFTNYSIGNMYYVNDDPTFNLYTNTIFDKMIKPVATSIPILIQFNSTTNKFITLLNRHDFYPVQDVADFQDLKLNALQYSNKTWYSSFKHSTDKKTTILFTKTYSEQPETITSFNEGLTCKQIGPAEFRSATEPTTFNKAPKKLQELLHMIPKTTPFYIHYLESSNSNTTTFSQPAKRGDTLEAYAMSLTNCSIAVFSDGTTYFAGKLPLKRVLKNGNTIAFKLPTLSSNYIYGNALLAGSNLYVSWEERDFYKTGKSGFLVVDLEKILYTGDIE